MMYDYKKRPGHSHRDYIIYKNLKIFYLFIYIKNVGLINYENGRNIEAQAPYDPEKISL